MKTIIKKRSQFPKCVQKFKELKGICIGGCIDPKIDPMDNIALMDGVVGHSHCYGEKYVGWICLKYKFMLKEKLTLLHEVAHLIANTSDKIPPHGKIWKETVTRIGGTYRSYQYVHNKKVVAYLDYTYRNNKF